MERLSVRRIAWFTELYQKGSWLVLQRCLKVSLLIGVVDADYLFILDNQELTSIFSGKFCLMIQVVLKFFF